MGKTKQSESRQRNETLEVEKVEEKNTPNKQDLSKNETCSQKGFC